MKFHIDGSRAAELSDEVHKLCATTEQNIVIDDGLLIQLANYYGEAFIQFTDGYEPPFSTLFGRLIVPISFSQRVVLWLKCSWCGTRDQFPIVGLYGAHFCPKCGGPVSEGDCIDATRLVAGSDKAGS